MTVLSKQQKLLIYEYVLSMYYETKYFCAVDEHQDGICHYIISYLHMTNKNLYKERKQLSCDEMIESYFPELYQSYPNKLTSSGYWFETKEERIDTLQKAILLVQSK